MRRQLAIVLLLGTVVLACGCASTDDKTAGGHISNGQTGVEDVLQAQIEAEQGIEEQTSLPANVGVAEDAPAPEVEADEALALAGETAGVDIDLTTLSSNMVYATVYDMMVSPGDYLGSKIRMTGINSSYQDPTTGKYYFACIITDATACCAQGIEYQLGSDYSCPEDYPADGEEITVTGTFSSYQENEFVYFVLEDAQLG